MSTDKMRIKSEKTGLEQDVTPETYKKMQAYTGPGTHEVIKKNTTPPEAQAARARTSAGATGTANKAAGSTPGTAATDVTDTAAAASTPTETK